MRRLTERSMTDRMGNAINRITVDQTNDQPYMQEVQLRGYCDEKQDGIEHFHPYGFSARTQAPTIGKDGTKNKAEGVMVFVTGNRSHGLVIVVGDRRYRLNGLQEGEVALHDDQGHQVHLTRDGIVISAPNSKKIVTQLMSDDAIPRNGASKDISSSDFGQSAQSGRATDASITLTKDSFTISHKQKVQYTVGNSSLTLEPSKITISSPTVTNTATARFETIGPTVLGLDAPGEGAVFVETVSGPAKQTYAKKG
jgi:phage gp45-like